MIAHVALEAFNGGTIALGQEGDRITVDVNRGVLTLDVPDAELEARRNSGSLVRRVRAGIDARIVLTVDARSSIELVPRRCQAQRQGGNHSGVMNQDAYRSGQNNPYRLRQLS